MAWGVSINQDKQDALGQLNAATTTADRDSWTAEVNRLDKSKDAKYWLAGATLLFSMLDAYVDAHLKGLDQRLDAEVGLLREAESPGLGVALAFSWGGER